MLPDDVNNSRLLVANASLNRTFLVPDSNDAAYLIDYELGGVALNDPSQGLRVKTWTLELVGDDVTIYADDVSATTLFTRTGITEISLAFDQNMRPFVAFVQDGQAKYWWFDTASGMQTFSDLAAADINPRCCIDDKRPTENGTSDIILAYARNNNLYFRAQRDRFTVEYLLKAGLNGRLRKVGMTLTNRLAFEIAPNSATGGGDPGDGGTDPSGALYLAGSAPDGVENVAYTYQYTLNGGTPPYDVTATGLPPGMTMSDTGLMSGTPTATGQFNMNIYVYDANNDGVQHSDSIQIVADEASIPLSVTGAAPDGVEGAPYSYQYVVAGGAMPYSVEATGLPAGLSIDDTGLVTGTPTEDGTFNITVTVTDDDTTEVELADTIVIEPAFVAELVISGTAPDGVVGVAYSYQYTITGGLPPYTVGATGLPAGLSISNSGLVTGTPTTAESASVTVTVTDAEDETDSVADSIGIVTTGDIEDGIADLFVSGEKGMWADFIDTSLLWQNANGTGAVTGYPDPIRSYDDKSPNECPTIYFGIEGIVYAYGGGAGRLTGTGGQVRYRAADTVPPGQFAATDPNAGIGDFSTAATIAFSLNIPVLQADGVIGSVAVSHLEGSTLGLGVSAILRYAQTTIAGQIQPTLTADLITQREGAAVEFSSSDPISLIAQAAERDLALAVIMDVDLSAADGVPVVLSATVEEIHFDDGPYTVTATTATNVGAIVSPDYFSSSNTIDVCKAALVINRKLTSGEKTTVLSYLRQMSGAS